jgi:hypothetical protein
MRLNPTAFNGLLNGIGQAFKYRKAFTCPCRNPNSGAGNPKCPKCAGKGVFWGPQVDATAGVASQGVTKQYAQFGQWEAGDAVFSIPESSPMYDAGRFDRMLMLNSTDRFSLTLTHGASDRVNLPIEAIEYVFWLDDAGNQVYGGIPAFDEAGYLTWRTGEPPLGKQFAVAGTRFTEYFVWENLPSDRGEHHGARLPKRVQARRFDLFKGAST